LEKIRETAPDGDFGSVKKNFVSARELVDVRKVARI